MWEGESLLFFFSVKYNVNNLIENITRSDLSELLFFIGLCYLSVWLLLISVTSNLC
jgi:hypothetical protein